MSAFTRTTRALTCLGVQLTRVPEAVDPGKWPILQNVRSPLAGTVQSRDGLTAVGASLGSLIHSILRFDDASSFATNPHLYLLGSGVNLYTGGLAGPFVSVDTGYSGNPLTFAAATPPQSPQPFVYVADSSRMRKVDANGHVYTWGLSGPTIAPQANLAALYVNIIEQFSGPFVPWISIGTGAAALSPIIDRVNTTISTIIYDNGAAPSFASIVPANPTGIQEGVLLTVNGTDLIGVAEATIPVATTTIAAILYDSGASGLCWIQPTASLGTGQLEAPSYTDYQNRAVGLTMHGQTVDPLTGVPTATPTVPDPLTQAARIRQIDFPLNAVVQIGTDYARILAVAVSPDGVQSFRCSIPTHAAGDVITGVAAFRAYCSNTYGGGDTLVDQALENTITPTGTPSQATAGVRTGAGWSGVNLATINGRATLPDDDVHLAVRFSDCTGVQTVRVYLSLESTAGSAPSDTDFTQNYYFFEWRQSDIVTAIQASNTEAIATVQAARETSVQNAQTNTAINTDPLSPNPTGQGIVDAAVSASLALGNNQWLALRCKIRDLVQVGTDPSRTLANVTAAEILVDVLSPNAVTVDYDALWISGGFGPDVGLVGEPYVYTYRYRSSKTGARSNPAPQNRGGVIPRRQQVLLTATQSADSQVDLIDWFRLGGTLAEWTYLATTANSASPSLTDTYADGAITGGETLDFRQFRPWPTQDLPRSGTCNVAGGAVQRVSGDTFNTGWAGGSIIIINGLACTLYGSPTSTSRLAVNENAGSGTGVPFTLPGPTLLSQNLFAVWGGSVGGATLLFACGDAVNPGTVHWTTGNDTETTSDDYTLDVTPASDPLQNGFVWDGLPYVASTSAIYVLQPQFNLPTALAPQNAGATAFVPNLTPCGRGFWTPWAFCVAPEGVYFLAADGIYLTAGGSPAVSITDTDLYPLFPHNGVAGFAVNGFNPPDLTQTTRLRLAWIDGWVYFDYLDTGGASRTLAFHVATKAWFPDVYAHGVSAREPGIGRSVHQALVGDTGGQLYVVGGTTDNGTAITATGTWVDNQGDVRRQKLYRDVMLKANLDGGSGIVTLGVTDNNTTLPPVTLLGTGSLLEYLVNTTTQTGIFGTNLTVQLSWSPGSSVAPVWTFADVAFQPAPELATSWLSGPTTHGLKGYQQVARALVAYVSTTPVTFSLIVDGVTYTYSLPTTAGLYAKSEIVLQAVKGLTFQYGMQASARFMLFDQDLEVWCQPWGVPGGYRMVKPF